MSLASSAKADITSVIGQLEAHWRVLEAEIIEINKDLEYCSVCTRKYGDCFNTPINHLLQLKREKKCQMAKIISKLEAFYRDIEGTRDLLADMDFSANTKYISLNTGSIPVVSSPETIPYTPVNSNRPKSLSGISVTTRSGSARTASQQRSKIICE